MRPKLLLTVGLLCAGIAWPQAPASQVNPSGKAATASAAGSVEQNASRRASIKRLVQVSGTEARMNTALAELFATQTASMKKLRPDIPAQFWDEFQIKFTQQFRVNDLTELLIPIYEKHFSDDEIKQLIAFYETPIGQRYVAESPAITTETMIASREWGRSLGEKIGFQVAQEMRDRGISNGTPPKPPVPDSLKSPQ